eukprot:scaffold41101_cov150-Skeletonema_dohrnii-CCMP3373.AAC.2
MAIDAHKININEYQNDFAIITTLNDQINSISNHNSHASSSPYVPKTTASTTLVEEIGGLPALERITTHFYNTAFLDDTIDKFIGSYDDPHADIFARWIHQKLTGTVVEYKQGKRAVGIKAVTAKEAHFTGHFPDRPIMHGVLQPSCVQG